MRSQSDDVWIVFNGEIYNFRELRVALSSLGYSFFSQTDTEMILAAYLVWGVSCLDRIRGMFSFVIYDQRRRSFFMARDRAGEKPLYYGQGAYGFAFASELKALMILPGFPRSLDLSALPYYFAYGYIPGEQCILKGIHKLPPAHAAIYSPDEGINIWRYWHLPKFDNGAKSEFEVEQCFEDLLKSSVKEQLVADVPVGILLSGGLDSSLVAAAASQVVPKSLKTYTITFPDYPNYDESKHARLVAEHIGSEHHELVADQAIFDLLPELARQFDEPMCDNSMIPTYLVSQLARQHCKVALGGDGGDELFAGYLKYEGLLKAQKRYNLIPNFLGIPLAIMADRFLAYGSKGRGFRILNPLLRTSGASCAHLFDIHSRRKLLASRLGQSGFDSPERYHSSLAQDGTTLIQKITRADFLSYLPEDILVKVDRASMLTSLEVRSPFLDHRIIEFAFSTVPDSMKCSAALGRKIILQRLARKWLPKEFDERRKLGFSLPLRDWMLGPWRSDIQDILSEAPSELFNKRYLLRLPNLLQHYPLSEQIFSICLFELWRRFYHIEL